MHAQLGVAPRQPCGGWPAMRCPRDASSLPAACSSLANNRLHGTLPARWAADPALTSLFGL